MAVSTNTLEAVIVARDQFSAKFDQMMGKMVNSMKKGQRHTEFFSGALTRMFAKFSIIEHGIRRVGSIMKYAFYPFKAVEEINMSLIRMSAMFTGMMVPPTGGETIGDQFNQAFKYSEDLFRTMIKINPYVAGGLSDLMLITEEMAKQGIALDINNAKQVQAFQNIANAVITVSAGYQNREVQIRQESRSLMEGVIRPTNQLAMMVNSMVGGNLKVMVDQWKRSGTLIGEMGKLLAGFEAAGGRISLTWDAVKTTFQSIIQLAMYENFQQLYLDLMKQGAEFNDWLMKNKSLISDIITISWDTVVNNLKSVLDVLKEVATVLQIIGTLETLKLALMLIGVTFPATIEKTGGLISILKNVALYLNKVGDLATLGVLTKQPGQTGIERVKESYKEFLGYGKAINEEFIKFFSTSKQAEKNFDALSIAMGEGLWGKAKEEAEAYEHFVGKFTAPGIKLGPQPADPEAVKKYRELLSNLEDITTKKGDKIWGSFWVKWKEAFEWAEKAGIKDYSELFEILYKVKEVYYKKEEIERTKANIKIYELTKKEYGGEERLINERAKLISLETNNMVEAAEYRSAEITKLAQKDFDDFLKQEKRKSDIIEAMTKRYTRHWESRVKAMQDWYKTKEEVGESMERDVQQLRELDRMYTFIGEKQSGYLKDQLFYRKELLEAEKEELLFKYPKLDKLSVELYYFQKQKEAVLLLREANLKHSDDFVEGWKVSYQKNLQDQYTWGQAAMEAYGGVMQSMSQTMGDFFYDAWTGNLKSAEDYFRSFVQSILRMWADMLAKMIAQQTMLKAMGWISGLGSAGAGVGGGAPSYAQTYGMAGVPPMHGGGIVPKLHRGLRSDEFPAILQSGEKVLSRGETSTVDSRRGGQAQNINITINAVDSRSFQNLLYENRGALDSLVAASLEVNGPTRKAVRR